MSCIMMKQGSISHHYEEHQTKMREMMRKGSNISSWQLVKQFDLLPVSHMK
jgi:hypothetical protein